MKIAILGIFLKPPIRLEKDTQYNKEFLYALLVAEWRWKELRRSWDGKEDGEKLCYTHDDIK